MKLIVGLGNPGARYKYTRHNIGFRIVDAIAKEKKISFKKEARQQAKSVRAELFGQEVALFKSVRFMNLTGLTLAPFVLEKKIEIKDILVVCDCLDLSFGKMRLKEKGSDAGHRGMRSIIEALGHDDFSRLKVGIGRPEAKAAQVSEFVLSRFTCQEEESLGKLIKEAKSKIYAWINNRA